LNLLTPRKNFIIFSFSKDLLERVLLVVKKHENIKAASIDRSFSTARSTLEDMVRPDGFVLDSHYPPVLLKGRSSVLYRRPVVAGFDYSNLNKPEGDAEVYVIRAQSDNRTVIENFKNRKPDEVVGIFADPKIETADQSYCGDESVGDSRTVAQKLGIQEIHLTGKNVRIAIVDTGIHNEGNINSSKGWAPSGINVKPGHAPRQHGTMCAFDAQICAPDAELLDYALLLSPQPDPDFYVGDAIAAYADLIDLIHTQPGPLVVSNSWNMYDLSTDYPVGDPSNYSANINHPLNQIVASLIAAGADVLFAAGNCGEQCPDNRCAGHDGPGKSIHGASSHPDTTTIAAVTTNDIRLGYSSQGPGGISQRKPDLAAYSQFKGSGVFGDVDGGTSAACPVAAGVVAAVREKISNSVVNPQALKAILQRSAIDVNGGGFDYDLGYGIINPKGILNTIRSN
jgi:hypothetical protein